MTHFSHANVQLSTHLSYCGQLFFSKANTICSYTSANKITWAISSHASGHKLTTVEVRKKSHRSQQIEALTPSPVASGRGDCWKRGYSPAGPNPALMKIGSLRGFSMTEYCCTYHFVFVPRETKPTWLALITFRSWLSGQLQQEQVTQEICGRARSKNPAALPQSYAKEPRPVFCLAEKAVLMRAAQRGLHVLQMNDSMCVPVHRFSSTKKHRFHTSCCCAFFCEALCTFLPQFPHLIKPNDLSLFLLSELRSLVENNWSLLHRSFSWDWHSVIDLLYCKGRNLPLLL